MFHAYAVMEKGGKLQPFEYDPGELAQDHVEIDVEYCGICHSDLSMINDEWGFTKYPLVPGHEATGTIAAVGENVTRHKVGAKVGLGWTSASDMTCPQCMRGDHNLCPNAEATIVGRHGAFADRVRCHAAWATPIPDAVDFSKAGPLLCGGVTVFNPIVQFGVKPTDRVGVIGIGGLGHMALQFLNKWGCEVVAFTSSDSKKQEALEMGAHSTLNSRSAEELKKAAGSFDFILSTVNVDLEWDAYAAALAPKGRLHTVGVVPNPIAVAPFALIGGQKSISGSPVGSPATIATMLDFCARHGIEPIVERFKMSEVNDAMERLEAGKARYRLVLQNDIA